jgi:hypothetical protein
LVIDRSANGWSLDVMSCEASGRVGMIIDNRLQNDCSVSDQGVSIDSKTKTVIVYLVSWVTDKMNGKKERRSDSIATKPDEMFGLK